MPANYALHQFGQEALARLPEAQQRPIQRFRRLYNGGLHGADLFFYFQPMLQTDVGELYRTYHSMTGREFFAQASQLLKQSPSEGGFACLYGLLANYCLSTQLSPLLASAMAQSKLSRTALEAEFDRHLLTQAGKVPAHTQDISDSLRLTRGECVTVSQFFPPATAANLWSAHRSMLFWTKRMAAPRRAMTQLLLKSARGSFPDQLMPDRANPKFTKLDAALTQAYARALERYPEMARQLTACLEAGEPLGPQFDSPFHAAQP